MVDLDDFKRINDTAGHAAGDQALVAVGDILRHTRSGDSEIARTSSRVTASIGVASSSLFRVLPREIPADVDDLVESADRAM